MSATLHGDLPRRRPEDSTVASPARPDLRPAFPATSTKPAGPARLRPARPGRHRPRTSAPSCGSPKDASTTSASRLIARLRQHELTPSDGPRRGAFRQGARPTLGARLHVHHREHRGTQRKADNRAVPHAESASIGAHKRMDERRRSEARLSPSSPTTGRRRSPRSTCPAESPALCTSVTSVVKDGPCDSAMPRRRDDLTSAQRSWRRRRSPPAQHASAQRAPDGTVPVPPPLPAAAPKTHRPPPRASSQRAHRPAPTALTPGDGPRRDAFRQRARPALGDRLHGSPQRTQRYREEGRQSRGASRSIHVDPHATTNGREAPVGSSSRGERRALRLGDGTTKRRHPSQGASPDVASARD